MTVDFDDTLAATITSGWGGTSLKPISRIMNFVFDKVRSGEWEAHIVSFRSEDDKQEMVDFVKGYKLPIKSITCTNSKNKTTVKFKRKFVGILKMVKYVIYKEIVACKLDKQKNLKKIF